MMEVERGLGNTGHGGMEGERKGGAWKHRDSGPPGFFTYTGMQVSDEGAPPLSSQKWD